MKRSLLACAAAVALVSIGVAPTYADVKTREKNLAKFEGMAGRLFNLFGGKAAREGTITTVAVKGDRKATLAENSGQIVDLNEEKIYDIDFKKKTYQVTTFDEVRRQIREARERAEKQMTEEQKQEPGAESAKEIEIDFDVKETGQRKPIAGYDAREVVMTVTVREKGKTLEESGGLVLTTNSWHGPEIPQMKESLDFDLRYWQKLQSGDTAAVSAEQMASLQALFPLLKPAWDRLKKEEQTLKGSVLATTMVAEGVKSKAEMAAQPSGESGGGSGLGGMLARKMKKQEPAKQRAVFMTVNHEVQEVGTSVAPADLAIPPGFKEKSR